jgi:iron complex transport system substrate-binding protein
MTEILFALSADSLIVGITTFSDYPEGAKKIYNVGDFSNPSMERIVGRQPNMVIVNLPEQARIERDLMKLNIPVFVSSPMSLHDIYQEVADIGVMVKREHAADSLIRYMKTHIAPMPTQARKSIYIELSPRPLITIGSRSFLNDLIEMSGGRNIFSDLDKDYPTVAQEEVIKRNPDIIILMHPESITGRLGWSTLTAVTQKHVYTVSDQDIFMRPGPRLVQGFMELKRLINE